MQDAASVGENEGGSRSDGTEIADPLGGAAATPPEPLGNDLRTGDVEPVGTGETNRDKAQRRAADRRKRGRRDWLGSIIGLLVFLGGVALLVLVFRLAYTMFQTPPSVALAIERGNSLNLATASSRMTEIIVRIILLVLMTLTGSVVANRGIHLYASSSGRRK